MKKRRRGKEEEEEEPRERLTRESKGNNTESLLQTDERERDPSVFR